MSSPADPKAKEEEKLQALGFNMSYPTKPKVQDEEEEEKPEKSQAMGFHMSSPTDPKIEDDDEEEEEEDLEKLQAEIARMEEEAERITKEAEDLEVRKNEKVAKVAAAKEEKPSRDNCSIYVGQVDYSTTPEELVGHFDACGTIERVTIVCDKYTGRPKGFAYVEFEKEESVENALKLDNSEFKGRQLKVTHKRVNVPSFQRGGGGGREGRGSFRGGRDGGRRGGGRPYRGGRGGRGRGGGGGGGYHPYY